MYFILIFKVKNVFIELNLFIMIVLIFIKEIIFKGFLFICFFLYFIINLSVIEIILFL